MILKDGKTRKVLRFFDGEKMEGEVEEDKEVDADELLEALQ